MKKLSVFVLILFFCSLFFMYAEATPKYVKMMKKKNVNFFDVKKEAEKYFKNRDKGKGSGWKQYKRWEYFWGERLYPSGDRSNLANPVQEMADFFAGTNAGSAGIQSANWVSLGPTDYQDITGHWSPGLGRINEIVLDPNNSNIIYVGSPSGGLWRSTTGGNSWTPLSDNIVSIGVSCVVIDPTDSNTIYIGTGDKDHYDCWTRGVLKSTDGGATWNTTGLTYEPTDWQWIHVLLMHPNDPNTLYAGTFFGIYKSTNGAATWTKVADGDFDDIEFKPGDPAVMYGVTNEDPSPIFYRSTDHGDTWSATSMTSTRRAQIAVTPANANYVYFYSVDRGTYRSTNSGVSFSKMGNAPTPGTQDQYDLSLAVSPTNANEVHVGEIETWASFNGGSSWTKTSIWYIPNSTGYIHCDIHEMVYFGNTLYIGSDGLITKTDDSASSFTDLSVGLGIRQFYRMGSGVIGNPYKLIGGSQDNGTSVYSTDHWHEWLGADGMECVINYNNENIVYGCIQNGQFYKSNNGGNNEVSISQPGGGDWVTPYVIDPNNADTLYVGNSYVRKTTNGMSSWSTIGNFGSGNINALAVAKSNPNYIYAAKDERVWRTSNGGGSWTEITGTLPGYFVTYISVHPSDPLKVALTLSSFWTYADGEKVFISNNGGNTWINYSANLPNLPALCVAYHGGANDAMYVGMDVGVYYRDNTLGNWEAFMTGLPNVIVKELEIDDNIGKIRAASYGRGLWESNLHSGAPPQPPVADFSASATTIIAGGNVAFTDLSTNSPTSWSWTFEGGTPGTSTSQNPTINYNTPGTYTVELTATNSAGSDTETKTGYITVTTPPPPVADFSASTTTINEGGSATFTDLSTNSPTSWSWTFDGGTPSGSTTQNPSVTYNTAGTYTVSLTATNSGGSDTETKSGYITVTAQLPTVGITDVLSSSTTTANRRAMPFTMPEDGTISSVTMYHTGGSGDMILGVYDGESAPQNRLAVTATTAVSGSTDWQTINLISPAYVEGGSTVWLAWVYESNPGIRYTSGSPGRYDAGVGWSGGMPDPFGSGSQTNYLYSIYAEYTPGGGPTQYTLTTNTVGQGSIILDPAGGTYNEGTVVTLTADPDSGWQFVEWSGDLAGSQNPTTITMDSDKTVTAAFSEIIVPQYTLTVNTVGQGSVTLDPPGGTYDDGTVVTLTADPDSGWQFDEWSGDLTGSQNPDNITMDADKTVTATFSEIGTTSTVGYDQVFSSTTTTTNRRAMPFPMPEDGTISSVTMYHVGGSGNMILGVYSGEGSPQNRLGVTPSTAVSSSTGWQTINLTTPASVSGGTTVWLAWVYESNPGIAYQSGSPGRVDAGEGWAGGMPDPFGSSSQANYIYSIYATYTPGANPQGTIGYTTVFGSSTTTANRRAMPFTMTEDGTIESVSMYHSGGSGNMILGVYDGTSAPQNRIAVTATTAVSGSTGWQTINLTTPVFVSNGTTIWLAWVYESNPGIRYQTGSPGRYDSGVGWSGGMPDPFGSGSQANYLYSIYATYNRGSAPAAADFSVTTIPDTGNNQLLIKHPTYDGSLIISIFNTGGDLMKKIMHNGGKTKKVNISDLPPGEYSLVLYNGQKEVRKNVVKK